MSWAHYILQVNIYLIVFYGFYKLLLDKETYFILNRIYLLSAGLLSLVIPVLRFEWFTTQSVAQPVYTGVDQLNVMVAQVIVQQNDLDPINIGNILVVIYLGGILIFSIKFIWQLLALRKVLTEPNSGTAFSFFGYKQIDKQLPEFQTINKHEEIHVRQRHSVDILFFELLGIFTWFNPFIYLYKKAVKSIHEYLADEEAAKFQGDRHQYALLLLSSAFDVPISVLSNSFFNKSLMKRRIFMLHKQKSRKTAILKYGLFLPLFAIALIMSSATIRNNEKIQDLADQLPLNTPIAVIKQVVSDPISGSSSKLGQEETVNRKTASQIPEKAGKQTEPGWDRFYYYIKSFAKYPQEARLKKIQGTTMVKFTVVSGTVENIGIAAKLGGGCDEEIMKTILSYPSYAGIKDGNYTLSVRYIISDTNSPKLNENVAPLKSYTALNDIMIVGYGGPEVDDPNKVHDFTNLDKQSGFVGGMAKFYEYLSNNMKYPDEAKKNNIQGKVYLSFVVEKTGELTDVKVDRKLGGGTDEEAVRVLNESPKWIPGLINDKPVRVKYNIPISFNLNRPTSGVLNQEGLATKSSVITFRDTNGSLLKFGKDQTNSPLIIVDGEIKPQSIMSELKPNQIKKVFILKDYSAIAKYGEEGKYGVILITTKKTDDALEAATKTIN